MQLSRGILHWSNGFTASKTFNTYLSATGQGLAHASHKCTATSSAPSDGSSGLCRLSFGKPTALPRMPNITVSSVSGVVDALPLYYLLSGGLLNGSVELLFEYESSTAVTNIIMQLLPDPVAGYPSSFSYEILANDIVVTSGTVAPSSTPITIPINTSLSTIRLHIASTGPVIVGGLLPNGTLQTAALGATMSGVILDPTNGSLFELGLTVASATIINPVELIPAF